MHCSEQIRKNIGTNKGNLKISDFDVSDDAEGCERRHRQKPDEQNVPSGFLTETFFLLTNFCTAARGAIPSLEMSRLN